MVTAGIIAEYNPFHNGHKYHIEETRRRTGADFIIAAISGDFVQRGAPALLDKFVRAKMALENGADLVLELPVTTALSSAEGFAAGGVCLFDRLGVVDTISFGCEFAEDPALFHQVARLLAEEPAEYKQFLQGYLKCGMSFPKARELAVTQMLSGTDTSSDIAHGYADTHLRYKGKDAGRCNTAVANGYHTKVSNENATATVGKCKSAQTTKALKTLLSEPNNTLALEYQKAIEKYHCHMDTCLIPRIGADYRTENLTESFSSATAIRRALLSDYNPQSISAQVPPSVFRTLADTGSEYRFLCENDFSDLLAYALLQNRERLSGFCLTNTDLARRIANLTEQFENPEQFTMLLKSKNQTYTAISRLLFRILLGITGDDLKIAANSNYAPYARILGFRKTAAPLLTELSEKCTIPIIRRPAKDCVLLDPSVQRLFDIDLFAADLYSRVLFSRSGIQTKSDLRRPPVIL